MQTVFNSDRNQNNKSSMRVVCYISDGYGQDGNGVEMDDTLHLNSRNVERQI